MRGGPKRRWVVALLVAAAVAMTGPLSGTAETASVEAGDVGDDIAPAGQSVLEEIFSTPDGSVLPYPFPRVLETLRAHSGEDGISTVLIPIGRSLQRFSADPHYFESPRIVVAAIDETAGEPARPNIADRIFLGYQPASGIVEAISYNAASGRFEFHVIEGYDGTEPARIAAAEREVCGRCHQGLAPIFSAALWSETNGNPAIAARLKISGETFHGVPVRQGIDGPDAVDQAVGRANRLSVLDVLWREGCGEDSGGDPCRRMLVEAALRFRLGGSRAVEVPDPAALEEIRNRIGERLASGRVSLPDPVLPDRDPSVQLAAGVEPSDAVEASGVFDPETPRAPVIMWERKDGVESIVRLVAATFTDADIGWLDLRLTGSENASETVDMACESAHATGHDSKLELRFECSAAGGNAVSGHVKFTDGLVDDGRIDRLTVLNSAPLSRLDIIRSGVPSESGTAILDLTETAAGLTARLADGRRVADLTMEFGDGLLARVAKITVADDTAPLSSSLDRVAGTTDLFSGEPFRRQDIMAALIADLGP